MGCGRQRRDMGSLEGRGGRASEYRGGGGRGVDGGGGMEGCRCCVNRSSNLIKLRLLGYL